MSRINNPPIATWFSQVVADQRKAHFMVFWHHYDAGSYTHTSNHGIFFDLDDAIDYAVTLIRRTSLESRTPLTQEDIEGHEEHKDFSDLTMDWGSRDLDIVDKSGNVLFHQVSHWHVSSATLTAALDFDYTTADQIRQSIKLDALRQSSPSSTSHQPPPEPSTSANPAPATLPQQDSHEIPVRDSSLLSIEELRNTSLGYECEELDYQWEERARLESMLLNPDYDPEG